MARIHLTAVFVVFAGLAASGCGEHQPVETVSTVAGACTDVSCIVDAAVGILRDDGVVAAISFAEREGMVLETQVPGACHTVMHQLGGSAVRLGVEPPRSTTALVACSGGFYHGLLAEYGATGEWPEAAVSACGGFDGDDAILCKHGYGHGAASGGGDLLSIQARCDEVASIDAGGGDDAVSVLELCSDGAFMEVVQRVEAGESLRPDPSDTCGMFDGWMAWGCWRQLGMVLEREVDVLSYARSCAGRDEYLADACAVGVAEAVVVRGFDVELVCGELGARTARCRERVSGRTGE